MAGVILPYVEQLAGPSGSRATLLQVALPGDHDLDGKSYSRFAGGTHISATKYLKGSDGLIIQAKCSDAPSRTRKAAVAELYRVAKKGLRGAMIRGIPPEDSDYGSTGYDRFWAAAEEIGIPVSLHVATRQNKTMTGNFMVENTLLPYWIQRSMASIIFSGVLDRFPGLKLVSAENDIGWVGNFLERMDYSVERHLVWAGGSQISSGFRPSELFHRNIWLTFMRDHVGIQTRGTIGVDNLMWSSDYPHVDATWPESGRVIEEQFEGVALSDKQAIVGGNVAFVTRVICGSRMCHWGEAKPKPMRLTAD